MVWSLLPPVGRTGKAAVIHDWLCDEHPHSVDHRMAADIFNEAMTVLGEPAWRRAIMVWAARNRTRPRFLRPLVFAVQADLNAWLAIIDAGKPESRT